MNEESTKPLEALEEALGYRFGDRSLLDQAVIHPSARHELNLAGDNQRMEYLGDAVLGLAAAEYLYRRHAGLDEGKLTKLRSSVTSTFHLAGIARRVQLGRCLVLGRGEEESGGADKEGNLADALEAVIGACYLDGGMEAARRIFERLFAPPLEEIASAGQRDNPKGRLQEWVQQKGWSCPVYSVTAEEGPSHQRRYTVLVTVGHGPSASGTGNSKRAAEADAAGKLLDQLTARPPDSY